MFTRSLLSESVTKLMYDEAAKRIDRSNQLQLVHVDFENLQTTEYTPPGDNAGIRLMNSIIRHSVYGC